MAEPHPPGYRDDLTAVETPLMATPSFAAGLFRCPVRDPVFAGSGPLRCHYVVFPRTAVRIAHEDAPAFTSTPANATVYNPGDVYRRQPVDAQGDRCDYLVVAPGVLRELMHEADPASRALHAGDARFGARLAAISARLYLRQRQCFAAWHRAPPDALAFDEACTRLLREVLAEYVEASSSRQARAGAPRRRGGASRRGPGAQRDVMAPFGEASVRSARQREAVERACVHLAQHVTETCTLADVARHAHLSPCHLARVFPRHTGYTLHAFQVQLRLRMALEDLQAGDPGLAALALRLGFSHHSHFTQSFRRSFQLTPRGYRRLAN